MSNDPSDIILTLNDINELFAEPAADPWQPASRYRSGIDEIMARLRTLPLRQKTAITIRLPARDVDDDLPARIRAAVGRYGAARIAADEDEVAAINQEGRRDFIISLVIVVLLLGAMALLLQALSLDGPLAAALIGWTGIASWAILWNPVDTFVWGRRGFKKDNKYCRKLMEAELQIESRPEG